MKFKDHDPEHICVYCKHYEWTLNDSKAFCRKHGICVNHKDTCPEWVDDYKTIKVRPYGFENRM